MIRCNVYSLDAEHAQHAHRGLCDKLDLGVRQIRSTRTLILAPAAQDFFFTGASLLSGLLQETLEA